MSDEQRRGVRVALRMVFWAFLGTVVLLVVAGALPPTLKNLPTKLLFVFVGYFGWRRFRAPDARPEEVRRAILPMAVLAVLNISASQACALLGVVPLVMLGGHTSPPVAEPLSFGAMATSLVINVGLTVLGEELLFRGAVLPALRPLGDRAALVLSAVLFGICHLSFSAAFLWALALGLLTGIARLRTGSLVPGMVVHGIGNTLGVAMSFSGPLVAVMAPWVTRSSQNLAVIAGCCGTLVLWLGGVVLLMRWLGWRWPERSGGAVSARALLSVSSVALVLLYLLLNVGLTVAMFRPLRAS